MRKLTTILIGLLFVSSVVMGQNYTVPSYKDTTDFATKVYIDPDWTGTESGTIEEPYNHWTDVSPTSPNIAYLIKAGTQMIQSIGSLQNAPYKENFNNNYIGQYGEGEKPIITSAITPLSLNSYDGSGLIIENIHFKKAGTGSYGQVARFNDHQEGDSVTIANCIFEGLNEGPGWPSYCAKGSFKNSILYHNEWKYSGNDGIYGGNWPNGQIVSNYFHHNNMNGVVSTTSTGDSWQLENAHSSNCYVANNFMTREHSFWKFSLIVNSNLDWQSNFVAEYNTFVAPKNSSAGGATIRWLGGTDNTLRKNLFNTWSGLPAMSGYGAHINQTSPYGARDNISYGSGVFWLEGAADASNLVFADEAAYLQYLVDEGLEPYGADLDTANFWEPGAYNPCVEAPIYIPGIIGNDTNARGTGYINTTLSGGYGTLTPLWSNDSITEDISGLLAGYYTITVIDDSSCSNYKRFLVSIIDTATIDDGVDYLTIDTVHSNIQDGVNVDTNMLDGDFATRWSANLNPSVAVFVLDNTYIVDSVRMAWYRGDERKASFAIFTSLDSINWTSVYADSSSGDTLGYESYDVDNAVAKYIKLEGYGNNDITSELWTSVTEFRALGDSASGCVDINLSASVTNTTAGASDGAINLTATGGSGSLSYLWTPGNTTSQDTTGLSQGTYSVLVTDNSSCTASDSWTVYSDYASGGGSTDTLFINNINSPDLYDTDGWLSLERDQSTFISLNGSNNERVRVPSSLSQNASEGNTSTIVNDSIVKGWHWRGTGVTGSYILAGFDPNQTFDLIIIGSSQASISVDGDTVHGTNQNEWNKLSSITPQSDSTITLSFYGDGGSGILYGWGIITSGGTVTTYPIDATVEQTNVDCYGYATGVLTVTPFNGVEPYTHSWDNDSTDASITGLTAGVYKDSLRDDLDSLTILTYTITQNDSIWYSYHVDDAVNGQELGGITIDNITGGNGTYSIFWNTGSTSLSLTEIPPGDYWFIITDGLGCTTDTVNVTVANDECNTITLSAVSTNAPNGTFTLSVDPLPETDYTYVWSNGEYTQNLDSLDVGTYSVVVTNLYTACQALDTFQVANIPTIRRATVINTGGKVRLNQNGKIITQ